jgi:prephenate dehydratase
MNENKTIGLGPHGTYTSEAMKNANEMYYRGEGKLVYVPTNADTIRELREANKNLKDGHIDRKTINVVPTYNSTSGNVVLRQDKEIGYTQEVLDEYRTIQGMYITGQVDVTVAQTLGYSGELLDIQKVMSNPNALNQSKNKLDKYLVDLGLEGIEIVECGSTAESLRIASENKHIAGIGSLNTVLELNLKTLRNPNGTVNHLTKPTITYMNLIHPAGNNLTIERLKTLEPNINNLNSLLVELNIPNYQNSLYDVISINKNLNLDTRAMSIRPNGTAAMTMLMDISEIDDGRMERLLADLQTWETKKGAKVTIKGAYNSSTWKKD